ncbi:MAG: type II toxin-antitoxin system RelE/ParE family toxin [Oscillospiraceae bacterium]|nr:type II toxin-antitoxin system RelE/ParE family toxin [Oscillospiraceae bacterium]
MKIQFSTYAKSDLKEIYLYLREHGEAPPKTFRKSFESFCSQVSKLPMMYNFCEYHPSYRKAVLVYDYLVYYKIDDTNNEILVFRVLHGKRNIKQVLQETDIL